MRLFLIRHGQTAWNVERLAQGHSDIPLDATGEDQVRRLAKAFHERRLHRVYTSDLQRSYRTALPLSEATRAELVSTPDLRERSFGEWEGKPYEAIRAGVLASARPSHEFVPPGGESMVAVRTRLANWLSGLDLDQGNLAIVSHGGSCSLLLALLLRAGPEASRSFSFANTGVTELHRRDDGEFRMVTYNSTDHLQEDPRESFGVIG
ncbi:MAG: histidine phosphatase family protein [Chthonomonas sp.]|nr:histidine phosphatase family protein [Chthonomonas sp.]